MPEELFTASDISPVTRYNALGAALPDDYDPVNKEVLARAVKEVFTYGIVSAATGDDCTNPSNKQNCRSYSRNVQINRNANLTSGEIYISDELPRTHYADTPLIKSIAADIDGDGYDEIVAVFIDAASGGNTYLDVVVNKSDGSGGLTPLLAQTITSWRSDSAEGLAINADWFDKYVDLAAGDFKKSETDDNGEKEILIYVAPLLYFIEGASDATYQKTPIRFYSPTAAVKLAVADYDLDGIDDYVEVVSDPTRTQVQFAPYYRIYNKYDAAGGNPGDTPGVLALGWLNPDFAYSEPSSNNRILPGVATYDVNNDGLPDTVFAYCKKANSDYYSLVPQIEILTTGADAAAHKPTFGSPVRDTPRNYTLFTNPMDCKNTMTRVAVGKALAPPLYHSAGTTALRIATNYGVFSRYGDSGTTLQWADFGDAIVEAGPFMGDIDGDGYDDLLMVTKPFTSDTYYSPIAYLRSLWKLSGITTDPANVTGYGYSTVWSRWDNTPIREANAFDSAYPSSALAIALPNVDSAGPYQNVDAIVLKSKKLVGRELLFTKPQIVTVLVSPPYWEGSANLNGGTSFGKSYGNGSETTHAVGASVGASVGSSVDFSIFGHLKTMITVEGGFHKGWTDSITKTVSISDEVGLGEDLVIFSSTAYEMYYYEVTDSSDPNFKGQAVSVGFPREMRIYRMEKDDYNEWIAKSNAKNVADHGVNAEEYYLIPTGNAAKNIGLGHTIGDPLTYPSLADRNTFQSKISDDGGTAFFTRNEHIQQVGTSSDTATTTIGLSEEIGSGSAWDWNAAVGIEIEASGGTFGKVEVGAYAKIEYEGSTTASISSETFIQGSVPAIGRAYWAAHQGDDFRWGLMAYPVADKSQKYTVVTYFVNK
jgi:hypothetical protein